jgi:hypothetical protein
MRKIIPALVAIAALAVPATSMAGTPGNVNCTDNSLAGKQIASNVTVPAGAHCDLSWATVAAGKNVTVNGSLTTYGTTHFGGNLTVNPGGSFAAANWGDTIDGNMSITDPATYSYNGFWGNYSRNEVKGNLTYTITGAANYPDYQAPLRYFGSGTRVDGNFTYSDQGVGFPGHLDTGGLNVLGTSSITQR